MAGVDTDFATFAVDHAANGCVKAYYQLLDREVGTLIDQFGPTATGQETDIYVVSDHGAQRMEGGFCINDWLIQEGYLVLKDNPKFGPNGNTNPTDAVPEPQPFDHSKVDWSQTRVWAEGGYYARLWLNIQGREPQGQVLPDQVESLRDELIHKLETLRLPNGQLFEVKVAQPGHLYKQCRGIPPDLVTYFCGLRWRALATANHPSLFSTQNDAGEDEANHATEGVFIKIQNMEDKATPSVNILDIFSAKCAQRSNGNQPAGTSHPQFSNMREQRVSQIEKQLRELGYF